MTSRGGSCQRLLRAFLAILLLSGAVVFTATGSSAAPEPTADSLSGTQPNIVVIVTDDQTVDSLPYMPYMRQQLQAGNYINFTQAEVNNSICCPSRATILTGQVDTRTGVMNNAQASNLTLRRRLVPPCRQRAIEPASSGSCSTGTVRNR